MSNSHPLEVVGSETQLQVGENLNKITWRFEGYVRKHGCLLFYLYPEPDVSLSIFFNIKRAHGRHCYTCLCLQQENALG